MNSVVLESTEAATVSLQLEIWPSYLPIELVDAGIENESPSISSPTAAKEHKISSVKIFAKCCHQSAAIGLRIKPRAYGRVRHVPDVGLGAATPPGGASSVVEPH